MVEIARHPRGKVAEQTDKTKGRKEQAHQAEGEPILLSKSQRVVELLVSGALLTGYIAFIHPILPQMGLGEQYLTNVVFLGSGLLISFFLIRSLRKRQTQKQIG